MGHHSGTGPKSTTEECLDSDLDSPKESNNDCIKVMMARRSHDDDEDNFENLDHNNSANVADEAYVNNNDDDDEDDSMVTPLPSTNRPLNLSNPKDKTTIAKSTKKFEVMQNANYGMSLLVEEQQKPVKLRIEKVSISLPSDRANQQACLIQTCEEIVDKHPHWLKEKILAVIHKLEPVIDLVMDL
jgi:hypothetical protein